MQPVFENSDLTATVIGPGVTVLETTDKTTMYLVEGDSAALLIDTGTSVAGLDNIVARLTDKPYRVVATHGHYDHIGNVSCFDSFYMHEADLELGSELLRGYCGKVLPLADGQVFDLGNRRLEVVHTPGHTPGSVVLVDYGNHMAFTGDAFGSGQLWMQLQPQVGFDALVESCGKMIEIMAEHGVDKLYVGHYPYLKKTLGVDYLVDVDIAARMIDQGDDASATHFGEDARLLRNGSAEIVYLPDVAGKKTLKRRKVLLKLDDVHYGEGNDAVPPRWNRLLDYLTANGLRANLGIIGYSLEAGRPDYIKWLQDVNSIDGIEFWNHGYHNRTGLDEPGEFEGDYDSQYRALHLTDSLAIANAGITLRAWGPHWTDCNADTDRALATVESLDMIFGHHTIPVLHYFKGKVMQPGLQIEYPYHNPVYAEFIVNYLGKYRNDEIFYLQGHPNSWDDTRWHEFEQIIERLRSDGIEFLNISQYVAM
ncbi:MAG: MBL fold metallo-hydrolase [Bacteroidales bacterium]|nr:MBL fold metallo-hydrolase [Bacteroidales bacterium]